MTKKPCNLEAGTTAEWIRNGDIEEAKNLASILSATLFILAEAIEKNHKAVLDAGVNSFLGVAELRLVAESLVSKPKNSRMKSGAERFAKVLVPGKPSKSFFVYRWIAATAEMNGVKITRDGKSVNQFVGWLNQLIDENNEKFKNYRDNLEKQGFANINPAIPRRRVTESQVIYALRRKESLLAG